jgi:hypothetical protein
VGSQNVPFCGTEQEMSPLVTLTFQRPVPQPAVGSRALSRFVIACVSKNLSLKRVCINLAAAGSKTQCRKRRLRDR